MAGRFLRPVPESGVLRVGTPLKNSRTGGAEVNLQCLEEMSVSDTTSSADLTLMLTSDGKDWCSYITSRLSKFPSVSHSTIILDDQEYENPPEVSCVCRDCPVILLLATPGLLEFLPAKAGWFAQALSQVPVHSGGAALVVFLLVDRPDLDGVTEGTAYDTGAWRYEDAGSSAKDVQERLARVLDVVERCKGAREKAAARPQGVKTASQQGESGSSEDGGAEDPRGRLTGVRAASDREDPEGEASEPAVVSQGSAAESRGSQASYLGQSTPDGMVFKTHKLGPPVKTKPRLPKVAVSLYPSKVYESGVKVAMVFKEEVQSDELEVKVEATDLSLTPHRLNRGAFEFVIPDELGPGKYGLLVYGDGKQIQCSHLVLTVGCRDDRQFTSPHYLRQALGLRDLQELDVRLQAVFSSTLPAAGLDAIFRALPDPSYSEPEAKSESLYPTMLHFAAANGLTELCAALLDCPCSCHAFAIRNKDGLDPAELAAHNGFVELEEYITEFMAMQTASNVYEHYMAMNNSPDPEEDYEAMDVVHKWVKERTASAPCVSGSGTFPTAVRQSLPPPQLPPRPAERPSSEGNEFSLHSPTGRPDRGPLPPPRGQKGRTNLERHNSDRLLPTVQENESRQKCSTLPVRLDAKAFMGMTVTPGTGTQPPLPSGACGSRSQSELIELNEMVKNKEINLTEASMLYQSWKERHANNVSMSFKERKMQIKRLKDEYMHIRETQNPAGTPSKLNFLQRFGIMGNHQTIKLNISDPVANRPNKPRVKVFTKKAALAQCGDRDSIASSSSSGTCSSRDSGWSHESRSSAHSGVYEIEDEDPDNVFQPPEPVLRRMQSDRFSSRYKRVSLGMQFLRIEEQESANPPPPLPPRNYISVSLSQKRTQSEHN